MFEFADLADFSGGPGGDISGGSEIAAPPITSGALIGGETLGPVPSEAGFTGDLAGPAQPGPADGKGGGSFLQPFADVAKAALPFVGLGVAGTGLAANLQGAKTSADNAAIARRGIRLQENIANQQTSAAAPLTQFGKQQLDASTAGTIPESIQAQIDQWAQGAKMRINDYFARSGQGNSLQLQTKLGEIDQQAKAMAGTFLQEQSKLGVNSLAMGANALGGAGNTASTIGATATTGSANIAALMQEANKALAMLESSAGKAA